MKKQRMLAITTALFVSVLAGCNTLNGSSVTSDAKTTAETGDAVTNKTNTAKQEKKKEKKKKQKAEKKKETEKTFPYSAELTSGYYTAGIDFPAGLYQLKAISGNGNVSSSNMFSGGLNAMMGVDDPSLYQTDYSNIDLSDGVVLNVSGGVCISISSDAASAEPLKKREQSNTETVSLGNGNFTAGTDFPAGVYDVIATGGAGNISSSNMFDGGLNAMMGTQDPSMYETEYKHVSLDEGVTLTIDGVQINLVPST